MKLKLYTLLFINFLLISCKQADHKEEKKISATNTVQYAKGFCLYEYPHFKKLIINGAFQGDNRTYEYYLISKTLPVPDSLSHKNIIRTPIERIITTSTTHIPMLELLGMEKTLVGFPNTKYISSKKTRQLIDNHLIKDVGHEQHINTELLLELQPELVVGFGIDTTSKLFQNIQKAGIPVLMNSDWLEKTPLGRAEWLRFFGALYNKDALALKEFRQIANAYHSLIKELESAAYQPTVLCGSLFQDVWYTPAGESFMARFLKDAHTDYLWKDTEGTGSLSLSLESVLNKAKNAEYWIASGAYTSKKRMLQDSPHYKKFKAFQEDRVYTYAQKRGISGGVIYYELAASRPDLVLQDLIKIFHGELAPKHEMIFFSKIT